MSRKDVYEGTVGIYGSPSSTSELFVVTDDGAVGVRVDAGAVMTHDLAELEKFADAIKAAVAIARRGQMPQVGVPDPDAPLDYGSVLSGNDPGRGGSPVK